MLPRAAFSHSASVGKLPPIQADQVGRGMAKLVEKKNSMLTPGLLNLIQLWQSYHLRVLMGRFMSMMAEKARQNQAIINT